MNFDRLWEVADRARARRRLSSQDIAFVREVVPTELESFPQVDLPKMIRHPAGFSISGAPVGTFLRSALLIAAQKALGNRLGGWRSTKAWKGTWLLGSCVHTSTMTIPRGRTVVSFARLPSTQLLRWAPSDTSIVADSPKM